MFASGFNRDFRSRCQNSRAVDQTGDQRSSAAAAIRTNAQPSATSRWCLILPGFIYGNQVRFLSLNCGRSSSRAGALPGPQPAGHQVRGRRHRRGRRKSRRVRFTRRPDHSDRGIQEVRTKTYMEADCTCQSEHFLLLTQQDLHHE